MNIKLVLYAFLVLVFVAPNSSFAQSQAEMNHETGKSLEKVDAELNKSYKLLIESRDNDPSFTAVLKKAQLIWLKYVDLHMDSVFPLAEGENPREVYGSVYPSEYALEKIKLLKQRIALLNSMK